MEWRLLELERHDAAMNMALDQAIYEQVSTGKAKPTIRFYQWEKPALSLGAYQSTSDLNLEACKHNDIQLVRRMTGGRAVFHGTTDFTYSVVVPVSFYQYSIPTAYRGICNSLLIALKQLNIKGMLAHHNDVLVQDKKISGNAAKMLEKGFYLQHGTLINKIDHELMAEIFRSTPESFREKVTSVREQKRVSQKRLYEALKDGFTKDKVLVDSELSGEERQRAEELSQLRYKSTKVLRTGGMREKGACYVQRGNAF